MIEKTEVLNKLEVMKENVKEHKKDKNNTELIKAFYKGYEKAIKEIERKIKEIEE